MGRLREGRGNFIKLWGSFTNEWVTSEESLREPRRTETEIGFELAVAGVKT